MPDPYLNVDGLKPETTEAIITRLEERGCHPFFLSAINSYAAALPRDRKLNILELGCGTGVVLRHVETIVDSSCELIGADISEKLLAAARTYSPENSKIRWDFVAPSGALPYADGYFDVIIMHTLLSHVPEIHAILCEAHRVLRPATDSRLIIFDADHASTTYSLPDFATTRETDLKLVSAISTHPAICRQLPVSKSFFISCFIFLLNVPNMRQLSVTPQTRWLHTSVS